MRVSILIASYNHVRFIREAINSALSQTFQDFEIIIVDDHSTDGTWAVISSFSDKRLIAERLPKNLGAAAATHVAFLKSKGEFICILNSDDRWAPDKLAVQLEFLATHPDFGAVFSWANFIGDSGDLLAKGAQNIFIQKNRTQAEWLRSFFVKGNCLCHPSVMLRRECFQTNGFYDNRFRQLPDFKFWLHLVKQYKIHVIPNPLVDFRIHGMGANTSSPSDENNLRTYNELLILAEEFFANCPVDLFYESFRDKLLMPNRQCESNMLIEQAFLFLRAEGYLSGLYRFVGLRKMFDLFKRPSIVQILEQDYKFSVSELYKASGGIRLEYEFDHKLVSLSNATEGALFIEIVKRLRSKSFKSLILFILKKLGVKIW